MPELRTKYGRLEYADTGIHPQSVADPAECLLLLHGAMMDETLWADLAAELTTERRVVVPTLPLGAHRTPLASTGVGPKEVADMVVELIEALDVDRVVLVGNDTGGAIAQFVAVSRPDLLSGLVLVSCDAYDNFPPGLPGRTMAMLCLVPGGLRMAMLSLRIPALRRTPLTFGWMSKRPIRAAIFDRWLDAFLASRDVRRDIVSFMQGVDRRELEAVSIRLRDFHGPALVVWAREDRMMPVQHAQRLADAMPRAHLVWVDDSFTLIPLDQPRALALALEEFVATTVKANL